MLTAVRWNGIRPPSLPVSANNHSVDQKPVDQKQRKSPLLWQGGSAHPPGDSVCFSGQASTRAASQGAIREDGTLKNRPLSDWELKYMVDQDADPYIGQTPMELQADTGLKSEQLFSALDQLSGQVQEYLRNFPSKDSPRPEQTPVHKILLDGAEITLRLLGSGDFGTAYELNDGQRSYAFKVHREPDEGIMEDYFPEHSVYQEGANGMYLTMNHITKDVARFYASNPRQHWTLSEFILPTASVAARDGKTLKEAGLSMSDDGERNRVAHIRVDLGGEVKPLRTGSW